MIRGGRAVTVLWLADSWDWQNFRHPSSETGMASPEDGQAVFVSLALPFVGSCGAGRWERRKGAVSLTLLLKRPD
jgi:hypothetical protein